MVYCSLHSAVCCTLDPLDVAHGGGTPGFDGDLVPHSLADTDVSFFVSQEWHELGFRVHWDGVQRRFTILNVSKRSFVLRGSNSSLATGTCFLYIVEGVILPLEFLYNSLQRIGLTTPRFGCPHLSVP